MWNQVLLLQASLSPAHETFDHRAGIPTTLLGDGLEHDPRRRARRATLNRERQRAILQWVEESFDAARQTDAGRRASRAGEVARQVGLDLLPPTAFGFHFSDNGTVSSDLLKRIAAGQEAVAFLDETTGQVYKIFNVRSSTMGGMGWGGEASANLFDWGAEAAARAPASTANTSPAAASSYRMGLKLAATKHHGNWQVETRSGNLFDMIEKVIALDGAGALPTEILGMLDTGDHLLVKQPLATDSRPAAYADLAAAAMGAWPVPAKTGLGDLRLFAWDQRHWFLTDLHPGNVFTWQGKPTVIDALIGEAPPALLADFPELITAAHGPAPTDFPAAVLAPVASQPRLFQ